MNSSYVLTPAYKSRCPKCHTGVAMLADSRLAMNAPGFFICFACKWVGEIGIGPVVVLGELVHAVDKTQEKKHE